MPSSPGSPSRVDQLLTEMLPDYTASSSPKVRRRAWHPKRREASRRSRFSAAVLTVALLGISVAVWASPPVPTWPPGPTPDQVALQRELARAVDLKRKLDEATAKLRQSDPNTYEAAKARADDLQRQLDEAEGKLMLPRADISEAGQRARAEDLQRRLKEVNEIASRPRPPIPDAEARARAEDLARKNDELERILTRPRPPVDPLANVTPSLTRAQIVAARNQFGLYTVQSPFNYGEVDLVQGLVARKANTVGYFASWKDPFNDFPIRNAWHRGQIPLMTWESQEQVGNITSEQPEFRLNRIYGGAFDDYIRSYARGIRDLRMPVIIRFNHEMNGNWYPWSEWSDVRDVPINGNSKGDYVKAWRHVHDIFSAEGANDYAIWLWAPNRVNRICGQRRPEAFYPGDRYVDWIGMSGYYRNYAKKGGDCDDISATFEGVFGATLPELRRIAGSKPIFLAEIGSTERGGDKVAWIKELFRGLRDNQDIIGFAWFSLAVSSGGENDRFTHDWRINSSPQSISTMREQLAAAGYGLPQPGG